MVHNDAINRNSQPPPFSRFAWVEYIKAIALLLIILVHFTERPICCANFANPTGSWPPLEARIAQLQPIEYAGYSPVILNVWRYAGWSGDAGVQLFLIISGFGLAWGLLQRKQGADVPLGWFYRRRLLRIYPLWWGAHIFGILFILISPLFDFGLSFFLSLLGLRITPTLFYYLSPAWWYIGLLIQLYLVFPFLWKILSRQGALRAFVLVGGVAFALRGIGLLLLPQVLPDYVDGWSRGSIFITRLPEFLFGVCFAWWLYHKGDQVEKLAKHPLSVPAGVLIYGVGMALSLLLWGMTFALFLLGLGLFIPLYVWLRRIPITGKFDAGVWLGQHSYSLFLTHHLFIIVLVRNTLDDPALLLLGLALALVGTLVSGLPLFDLREPLRAVPECPYQPYNLHWLESGHEAVAEYIAQVIARQYVTADAD
jgi:peptidoglycan/LPS O-acetylase OafA/YrhL